MGWYPPFVDLPIILGNPQKGVGVPPSRLSDFPIMLGECLGIKPWRYHRASLLALSRFCVNFGWSVKKENVEKKVIGLPV